VEDMNGKTDKCMKVNGSMASSTDLESGEVLKEIPT